LRPAELAKMFDLEDSYWWFVARRELVRALLVRHRPAGEGMRVLDVGCGTGATLKALSALGTVVGIDRSAEALRYCRQRGSKRLALGKGEELPIASECIDVVLALDLLEHIEDDGGAARELARVLRPGGVLVVTVPACAALWSEHDEALDHVRRYGAPRLRRILLNAGLRIEKLSHVITALLVPVAALRLAQRLLPRRKGAPRTAFILPPAGVNRLLIWLLRLEQRWLERFDLPAGVSLVAVARK
jgi:SAM-dependent methyltransferase